MADDMTKYRLRGDDAYAAGEYHTALRYYNHILEHDTTNDQVWIAKGNTLLAMDRHTDALRCYDYALNHNPDNTQALLHKGRSLLRAGSYREARLVLERAVRLEPEQAVNWFELGNVHSIGFRAFDDAAAAYGHAVELDPKNEKYWLQRGIALLAAGWSVDAKPCFQRVLDLNPDNADARRYLSSIS